MVRQITRLWAKKRHTQRGFTILEAMVAFAVLLVIISGLTTALTSSMRLNNVQKQRALAQDIVRDVISRYLKNEDYDAVNPFDNSGVNPATYFGTAAPLTQELYKIVGTTETNNLADYNLELLRTDLQHLRQPRLILEFRPIKKDATNFYDTKINAVCTLTWDGTRTVSTPVVIGKGDVTRTAQGILKQPSPTASGGPVATPTPVPTPTVSGVNPTPTPTPTPTPSASICLPQNTVCGTNATCNNDCCSGGSWVDMGTRKCN